MAFIKEESEDIKIEETFSVKQEDTEEQTGGSRLRGIAVLRSPGGSGGVAAVRRGPEPAAIRHEGEEQGTGEELPAALRTAATPPRPRSTASGSPSHLSPGSSTTASGSLSRSSLPRCPNSAAPRSPSAARALRQHVPPSSRVSAPIIGDEVLPFPELTDEEAIYRVLAIFPGVPHQLGGLRSSRNSTLNTQIAQLPGVEVGPIVVVQSSRQEPPLDEGVLSRSHNHRRPLTFHCHQISTHYKETLLLHLVRSRLYEH
ncbi:hypothetical protein DPX16_1886 [Anabarilius grahami]|uniref:Uncharacterized protein n=1 Tax=Anabarilius grahami TaxID=495550 RepID=A0A3N0YRX2_ANAGA|nr:hypothetical protein DPX16_1886 [Anabarilius grahami]